MSIVLGRRCKQFDDLRFSTAAAARSEAVRSPPASSDFGVADQTCDRQALSYVLGSLG
mgnify:CR=1 FL=1